MNRLSPVLDMGHSGERSTRDAIGHSARFVAITRADPSSWHSALRDKFDGWPRALGASVGMPGLSTHPHHLRDGGGRGLQSWCDMAARAVDPVGPTAVDHGEGRADAPGFP